MTLWRLLLLAALSAAAWFGWRWIFPDDETRIRAVLDRIAGTVSGGIEESEVGRLARAASIRNALDPEITVDAGPPFSQLAGRDTILASVARFTSTARDLTVSFDDVAVRVSPERTTANVHLTALARFRGAAGDRELEARELDVTFRRRDGDWVVASVTLVPTLAPITP